MFSHSLQNQYICPGETYPISRAVHLARLAAYFPACRECPYRNDPEALRAPVDSLPETRAETVESSPAVRNSIFETDGVRGIWRNELTRGRAGELASAFAAVLWEAARAGTPDAAVALGERVVGPAVVVGHDERPSSPDLVTGVA